MDDVADAELFPLVSFAANRLNLSVDGGCVLN
jgi:hypothetical protein